jgi:mycoredoxin
MNITMYSTSVCADCHRARQFFAEHNIPYNDIDIEVHPEFVELIEKLNKGLRSTPTIVVTYKDKPERVLVEPSWEQLAHVFLRELA